MSANLKYKKEDDSMEPWTVELPCKIGTKIYCDHPRWQTGYGTVKEFVLTQRMDGSIDCQVYIDWTLTACPNPLTIKEFRKFCVEYNGDRYGFERRNKNVND